MNDVKYSVTVHPFAQTNDAGILTIDNENSSDKYYIVKATLKTDILDPKLNVLDMEFRSHGTNTINVGNDFAGGNIITFSAGGHQRFIGYVGTSLVSKSITGTLIRVKVHSLLYSWSNQITINNYQDATILGKDNTLTNFTSNNVLVVDILDWFVNESVINYVSKNITNSNAYVFKNGTENFLGLESKVWFYGSMNKTRLESVRDMLMPYQRVIYQDEKGIINISPLSLQKSSDQKYIFDLTTNDNINGNPWLSFTLIDNSANVPNRTYAMLIPIGVNIANKNEGQSTVVAVSTPETDNGFFTRETKLLNSGEFEQSTSYTCDLGTNMITDPSMLTYLSSGGNSLTASLSGNSPQGSPGIAKLYSVIFMASSLFNSSFLNL